LNRHGRAAVWLAEGDCLTNKNWAWVVRSRDLSRCRIDAGATYRVRHQVIFDDRDVHARFRVWQKGRREPATWLCVESTCGLPERFPRPRTASFGLFQYGGRPTEWSNIRVTELDRTAVDLRERRHHALEVKFLLKRLTGRSGRAAGPGFGQ
jgi:hypothetical protein